MSYIVAFVRFSERGNTYPVECFRSDLIVGDNVLVTLPKRLPAAASVEQLAFLNWECRGQILCKLSEADLRADGLWVPQHKSEVVGLVTGETLVAALRMLGWISLKPRQIFRFALTYSNASDSANILIRKNGVELQILPSRRTEMPRPFKIEHEHPREGRSVSHSLSHTTFNLYDGVFRFAHSFIANEGNYDRFFKSVGSRDKRTETLKQLSEVEKKLSMEPDSYDFSDYFDEISDGSGGNVYIGDGISIGANGSIYDDGR